METATGPFILRSMYKDDYLVKTNLVEPVTQLLTGTFGAQVVNRYDVHIEPVMKGFYTFCSLLKGQTLGQEFCDILPAIFPSQWRSVGISRKLLLSLFEIVEPSAIFYAARLLFPSLPPHEVLGNVHKIVLCLFFLFETYATLPHRLLRVQFIGLRPSRSLPDSEGARGTYFLLGLVVLVELTVRFWRYQKAVRVAKEKERLKLQRKRLNALRRRSAQEHHSFTQNTNLINDDENKIDDSIRGSSNKKNVKANGYTSQDAKNGRRTIIGSNNLNYDNNNYENVNNDNDDDDDDDDDDSVDNEEKMQINGKCMLCLSYRKCPTSTQCGHVFCWRCIAGWIQSNPAEAVCPFCRQHVTAQSLVPLYFYVVNEPNRLNTSNSIKKDTTTEKVEQQQQQQEEEEKEQKSDRLSIIKGKDL